MRSYDFLQLFFIQAKRFFAEDMLTALQRCDHLLGMQMMARSNYNRVDRGSVENFEFTRGAGTKSEFVSRMPRMGSVSRTRRD